MLINHSVGFYDGKQFARAITGRKRCLGFVDALIAASGARYYFHRVNAGCRLKIWKVNNSSSQIVIYIGILCRIVNSARNLVKWVIEQFIVNSSIFIFFVYSFESER